jgi:PKD repeat protein
MSNTADFIANHLTGVAPLVISFTPSTSGSVASYDWNFGDGGNHSIEGSTNHQYIDAGSYDITLTVNFSSGSPSQVVVTKPAYIVLSQYLPSFTWSSAGHTVTFTDTGTYPATPDGRLWDFGDGNTSTAENPTHTYASGSEFMVTLTVQPPISPQVVLYGYSQLVPVTCPAITPTFQVAADCYEAARLCLSIGVSPPFNLRLLIGANGQADGQIGTYNGDTGPIQVTTPNYTTANGPPNAVPVSHTVFVGALVDFVGVPLEGPPALVVKFTDLSTPSPDGWLWDFGDGSTGTEQNPTHSYLQNGHYTVSLTGDYSGMPEDTTKIDYVLVATRLKDNKIPPSLSLQRIIGIEQVID